MARARGVPSRRPNVIPEDELEDSFLGPFRGVPPLDTAYLRGETIGSVAARVGSAMERLFADPSWDTVLLVLHGGSPGNFVLGADGRQAGVRAVRTDAGVHQHHPRRAGPVRPTGGEHNSLQPGPSWSENDLRRAGPRAIPGVQEGDVAPRRTPTSANAGITSAASSSAVWRTFSKLMLPKAR